jgi:RNA polymerase-associated protein RTF1
MSKPSKPKKNLSDSESGEVKEDHLNEEEKKQLESLSEVKREEFISNIYEKRKREQDRKKVQQQLEREKFQESSSQLPQKRVTKLEADSHSLKKSKQEEIDYKARNETSLTKEDIEKIRISRSQLAKWCNHIFFEDTVKGAFVRINIGLSRDKREQVYLMCEVNDVISGEKFYDIEGKVKTNKKLILSYGKSKKEMRFDIVSNAEFTEKEFEDYKVRLGKDGMKPVTQHHVQLTLKNIQNAINYKYKRADIDQLVEKQVKESLRSGKVEATAILELDKLKVQLEDLRNSEDSVERNEKIKSLEQLVQELEKAIRFDDKIVESDVVQRLNEKNRCKQLEIDSKRVKVIRLKRRRRTRILLKFLMLNQVFNKQNSLLMKLNRLIRSDLFKLMELNWKSMMSSWQISKFLLRTVHP